jgi:hypothetical protein
MQLKLTRSQREAGAFSKSVVFCLDARAQLTAEEQASVNRYKLGGQVIYNSEAARRHLEAFKDSASTGTARGYLKAMASAAMAAMHLNITINGLQQGQHIECKSLDELLSAEDALMTACQNLKAYLDTAATFDGREVLFDFSGGEPALAAPVTAPPPMLAAPPAYAPAEPPHQAAAMAQPMAAAVPAGAAPDYPSSQPFEASLEDWLQRAKLFWDRSPPARKLLIGIGAGILLLMILRAL